MKFAHFADCHIGAFRDAKLRALNMKAFEKAVDEIITEKVDFLLIAGDLFNISVPAIDVLEKTVKKLKLLQKHSIPVYAIAGSHDFSPSGKTIIGVLEAAGLLHNVVKGGVDEAGKLNLQFTIDEKTGAKITGMLGKKGMLDKKFYEDLDLEPLESESGFKIFMFHTSITELRGNDFEKIESIPMSSLPRNFSYYAGGHLHERTEKKYGTASITYPGPLFPENADELEKLKHGSYILFTDGKVEYRMINIINTFSMKKDCSNKNPNQVEDEIKAELKTKEFLNTIVIIKLYGTLASGKPTDINWNSIYELLNQKQAYFIMRNTYKLVSKEFEDVKIDAKSAEDTEDNLIKEHKLPEGLSVHDIKEMMHVLSTEKMEGETKSDFERRIIDGAKKFTE